MEAARNVSTDWTSQEDRSEEDTTIIECVAIPTGLELLESRQGRSLQQDSSLPMIGSDIRVFTADATREIVNREISPQTDLVFLAGNWLVNQNVPIYARAEDFMRLHFAVFGFTGAGKSNLLSTYLTSLLSSGVERNRAVKIVVFDLMAEYTVLLMDQLVGLANSCLIVTDEHALPGAVVDLLSGQQGQRELAVNQLVGSSLYPRQLERHRDAFRPAFERLLAQNKIRVRREPVSTFDDFLRRRGSILREAQAAGGRLNPCGELLNNLNDLAVQSVTDQVLQQALNLIDGTPPASRDEVRQAVAQFREEIEQLRSQIRRQFAATATISLNEITSQLNDLSCSSLFLIQSHDPDDLREFASELGRNLYELRRRRGIIHPLVSFVFDEADEFIPGQYERDSSYARSAWIAETLARRGRKFGIGVGIGTQRVRHLKVSVMAQPHTFLLSKMPRIEDRVAVQEAFGFSEEMFRQTFKFAPGDWIIVSHDATGLRAVPIPIHAANANRRVIDNIRNLGAVAARVV